MKMPSPSTLRDVHVYGGLLVAWVGASFVSIAWATVGFGLAVTWLGLSVPKRAREEND